MLSDGWECEKNECLLKKKRFSVDVESRLDGWEHEKNESLLKKQNSVKIESEFNGWECDKKYVNVETPRH